MTARIYQLLGVFTYLVYLHLLWVVTCPWSPSRPPRRDVQCGARWTREKMLPYPEEYASILEKHFFRDLEPYPATSNYENGVSE